MSTPRWGGRYPLPAGWGSDIRLGSPMCVAIEFTGNRFRSDLLGSPRRIFKNVLHLPSPVHCPFQRFLRGEASSDPPGRNVMRSVLVSGLEEGSDLYLHLPRRPNSHRSPQTTVSLQRRSPDDGPQWVGPVHQQVPDAHRAWFSEAVPRCPDSDDARKGDSIAGHEVGAVR